MDDPSDPLPTLYYVSWKNSRNWTVDVICKHRLSMHFDVDQTMLLVLVYPMLSRCGIIDLLSLLTAVDCPRSVLFLRRFEEVAPMDVVCRIRKGILANLIVGDKC